MSSTDVKGLETRGFVLIPSFLSEAELQLCREDFAKQPVNTGIATTNCRRSGGKPTRPFKNACGRSSRS
jgi:hypothetical protein